MEIKKEIKTRLIVFCQTNKITQTEIADGLGIIRQSVGRWFDTECDTLPSLLAVEWLVTNYKLNSNWLLIGTGGSEIKPENKEFGYTIEKADKLVQELEAKSEQVDEKLKMLDEIIKNAKNGDKKE